MPEVTEVEKVEKTEEKPKTAVEELNELEKQYIDICQQVEIGKNKQLECLQAMMPKQIKLLTGIIKNLQDENELLKKQLKEAGPHKDNL